MRATLFRSLSLSSSSSTYQLNFTKILLTMLATKPAELTLVTQKATKGFTVIVDRPMDNDLFKTKNSSYPSL